MKKKRLLCLFMTLCIMISIISGIVCVKAVDDITVILDGKTLEFDVPPMLIDDRTMVPLRKIFESMGATVQWDEANETITSELGNIIVKMKINSPVIYINDNSQQMDVSPVIIDDRTLVPARFVAEAFGANVTWDDKSNTVIISTASNKDIDTATASEKNDKVFDSNTQNSEPRKDTFCGVSYDVPSVWWEKIPERDKTVYYYFQDGLLMLQSNDDIPSPFLDNEAAEEVMSGISQSLEDYKFKSMNKITIGKNTNAYVAEISGVIESIPMNIKMLFFINNNSLIIFMFSDYSATQSNMKEFDKISDSIQIDKTSSNSSKDVATDVNKDITANKKTNDYASDLIQSVFDSSKIKSYLTDNYASVDTDMGTWKFEFSVTKNDMRMLPEDYTIWVEYDYSQMHQLNYSNKLTDDQIRNTKRQLKSFMKLIADDLIEKLPDKKLEGCYHHSYYKYPNLKMDLVTSKYCSWNNYDENATIEEKIDPDFNAYQSAKVSEFKWDQKYDEEVW